MAQFYYDFGAYADGDIETNSAGDFTVQERDSGATMLVTTDAGATGGKTMIMTGTSDGANHVVNDEAGATAGDIEVVARFQIDEVATLAPTRLVGPALVDSTGAAYGISVGSTTSVQLRRYSNTGGSAATIGSAQTVTSIPDDSYVWARVGRTGTTIRMRFWIDGETEPDWQQSGTDATLTTVKGSLSSFDNSASPYRFDIFGVGTEGDAAPIAEPPVGGGGGGINKLIGKFGGKLVGKAA